jgi:cell division protein FtsW (lipid II flippase)
VWIFVQFVINIGSVLGVAPVIGVTLPFISAGGSSLISLWMAVGVVMNIWKRNGKAKRIKQARLAAKL